MLNLVTWFCCRPICKLKNIWYRNYISKKNNAQTILFYTFINKLYFTKHVLAGCSLNNIYNLKNTFMGFSLIYVVLAWKKQYNNIYATVEYK